MNRTVCLDVLISRLCLLATNLQSSVPTVWLRSVSNTLSSTFFWVAELLYDRDTLSSINSLVPRPSYTTHDPILEEERKNKSEYVCIRNIIKREVGEEGLGTIEAAP